MEELAFNWAVWVVIYAAVIAAGLVQGMFGFGFPAVSTPVLVLVTDVKTAIIINLLPNITLNLISVLQGGNWGQSLGKYWRVAIYVAIGSFLGAQVLIHTPSDPLRLLLAAVIFAYLYQEKLARLDWSWLSRHQRASEFLFGLGGGFFSGTVNLSLPVLIIYFSLIGLSVTAMTQIMNLCFFGGRSIQAITLGAAGEISVVTALANIPLTLVAVGGTVVGMKLQRRLAADAFNRILKRILFVIAVALTAQGLAWFVR